MPASEPAPEHPAAREAAVGREEEGGGAGFGTQVLLLMAIFGFATCVTMLGPLLVDLSRELDVSLGQAGLLAAAMAVTWAISAPFAGVLSDRFGRGALFTLVNASSRPALLALSTELSTRYRGAILGVFSLTNQVGIVLGSSVGGLAIGLSGYGALAVMMAIDGALASGLALPLLRRRPAA